MKTGDLVDKGARGEGWTAFRGIKKRKLDLETLKLKDFQTPRLQMLRKRNPTLDLLFSLI